MRSISPPKNLFLRGIYLMTRRYLRHNVGIQSAALAFYLLFTLFPVLIFISALDVYKRQEYVSVPEEVTTWLVKVELLPPPWSACSTSATSKTRASSSCLLYTSRCV